MARHWWGVDPSSKSTGSQGIGGAITGASAAGQGGTSNLFQTEGLTFGTLQVRGGRGRYQNAAGAASFMGYRYIGPAPQTGTTFYTSHLVRLEIDKTTNSVISLRMNASNTSGAGDSFFVTYSDSGASGSPAAAQYGKGSYTSGSGALSPGPTYLVIGRFTNVGGTGAQEATTYILNEAQFANYAGGGFGEAQWDAVTSFGTGPDQLVGRARQAIATGTTATSLATNGGIQFGIGNAGSPGQDVSFDEMRCASTLAETIPTGTVVPEPDPALISFTVLDATATEPTAASPTTGRIRIARGDASVHQVALNLAFSGTAKHGRDYYVPTTIVLPANIPSVDVEIKPAGDREVEGDETAILTVLPGTGYTIGSPGSGTITIQDGPAATRSQIVENLSVGIPHTLVVYGTSLTEGGAWPGQVKAGLDAAYPGLTTLINSGSSSQNSVWGKANLTAKIINLTDPELPSTVMIEFAVNDAVIRTSYHSVITPAQARDNLNHMLDRIRTERPHCEVILQVMNPVINTTTNPEGATTRPNLALCQQTYRNVGKERGLLVIDHMPAWQAVLDQGSTAFTNVVPDGLHPGTSGYQLYVTPVILRELGVTNLLTSGTVILRADNHRAAEPTSTAAAPRTTKVTVTRGGSTTTALTVPLSIGGTAANGTDYPALPASIVIPAGADSTSILMSPSADDLAEGEETFTVGITSGSGYTLGSPDKASLFIGDKPFDQWRKSRFDTSELADPLISGDRADPDGDGIMNLIEFFTGHLPKTPDQGTVAVRGSETLSGSSYLTLTYDRIQGNGLTGNAQISTDLVEWREGPAFFEETILNDTGLIQTVKARALLPTGTDKQFIRLKALREP